MKKNAFIILALVLTLYLVGCGKKEAALEESQEPMSMESLSTINTETKAAPESKAQTTQATPVVETTAAPVKLAPLPPSGPYKPTTQEIQTALKNAGFYKGAVDGKSGPMTKKAIEEFQKANALKVDGKVGTKTWAVLSKHLNPPAAPEAKKK
jgi:peptidoglycan hydrolase-like protein with peptidoglycan-binding domain